MCDAKIRTLDGAVFDIEVLRKPVQELTRGVAVLGEQGHENQITLLRTPYSMAAIEAGATAFAKWWSVGIGTSGVVAITATVVRFWGELRDQPRLGVVVLAGLSLVIASIVIAIAIIVRADVLARGTSSAAQYRARADITKAYLEHVFPGTALSRGGSGRTGGGSEAATGGLSRGSSVEKGESAGTGLETGTGLEKCPFVRAASTVANGKHPEKSLFHPW